LLFGRFFRFGWRLARHTSSELLIKEFTQYLIVAIFHLGQPRLPTCRHLKGLLRLRLGNFIALPRHLVEHIDLIVVYFQKFFVDIRSVAGNNCRLFFLAGLKRMGLLSNNQLVVSLGVGL